MFQKTNISNHLICAILYPLKLNKLKFIGVSIAFIAADFENLFP